MKRILIYMLAACVFALSVPVYALSLLDPFNVPGTMDGGVVELGKDVAYGEGPRRKLDVYAPQNPTGLAPVITFIYGGGWNRGTKADYTYLGHAMAAQGFVVVIADYRLVPEVRYPGFLTDCADAIRWVQDNIVQYGGDKDRLFLMGHSAGAYNAVMLGLDPAFLRDAGVTVPIRGVAALSGPYDFYPFTYPEVQEAFGHSDNPQFTQPVNLITASAPPLFLATGTTDPIVRMVNTENLANGFRASGLNIIDNYYDGFGHMEVVFGFSKLWRWRLPVMDDVVGFFTDLGAFRPAAELNLPILADSKAAGLNGDTESD